MNAADILALIGAIKPSIFAAFEQGVAPLRDEIKALRSGLAAAEARNNELIAENKELQVKVVAPNAEEIAELLIGKLAVPTAEEVAKLVKLPTMPTADEITSMIKDMVTEAVAALPKPKDGESVDPAKVKEMVDAAAAAQWPDFIARSISDAVAALPKPKDGESVGVADVMPKIKEEIELQIAALPKPKDGESVDMDVLKAQTDAAVKGAMALFGGEFKLALPEIVKEAVDALPKPKDGESVDEGKLIDKVHEIVIDHMGIEGVAEITKQIAALPKPKDGESVDPATVVQMVSETVERAVAALPKPKDGESVDKALLLEEINAAAKVAVGATDVRDHIKQLVADAVAALPKPKDGESVDVEQVRGMVNEVINAFQLKDGKDATPEMVEAAVNKVLATWEKPKDGVSVSLDEVKALVEKAVAELPKPKDGAGVKSALIDRDGQLVITFDNGETKTLGKVVGERGNDGVNADDFDIIDDGDTFKVVVKIGERVKEKVVTKPSISDFYKGIWKDGMYKPGDLVTWGGSLWMAQRGTNVRPEAKDNDDWKLVVKRGRDGADKK